jgi:hypothetical protein
MADTTSATVQPERWHEAPTAAELANFVWTFSTRRPTSDVILPTQPTWLTTPPHVWRAGALDRTALIAQADALARCAGFDNAAQRFATCWLQTQAEHPELRAVFRNTPRYLLLVASLVLHHRRDPVDPRSGITPGRLQGFFEHTASAAVAVGDGQVKAMLAHARLHGFLEPMATSNGVRGDARTRPLQPTALLQSTMHAWVMGFLRPMECLPELALPDTPQNLLAVPGVVPEMFSYRMAALKEDRFVLFEGLPGLRWVLAHDHGYRLFLNLVRESRPQPDGSAVLKLSAAALARASGVPRGTVRNLLQDAASQDWFDGAPSAPGAWRIRAPAWALARHWLARELLWMHGLVCAAHSRCASLAPPTRRSPQHAPA